jgi:hypothetical protein
MNALILVESIGARIYFKTDWQQSATTIQFHKQTESSTSGLSRYWEVVYYFRTMFQMSFFDIKAMRMYSFRWRKQMPWRENHEERK